MSVRKGYLISHTHTHLTALFPGLPRWAGTWKVDPIWILLEQETMSGSGISWAICKSAPCSRQTTMPAPHRSVFYRPDALPAAQPTSTEAASSQDQFRSSVRIPDSKLHYKCTHTTNNNHHCLCSNGAKTPERHRPVSPTKGIGHHATECSSAEPMSCMVTQLGSVSTFTGWSFFPKSISISVHYCSHCSC